MGFHSTAQPARSPCNSRNVQLKLAAAAQGLHAALAGLVAAEATAQCKQAASDRLPM